MTLVGGNIENTGIDIRPCIEVKAKCISMELGECPSRAASTSQFLDGHLFIGGGVVIHPYLDREIS
ncbi:MAG: hypothetical protein ACMUIU_00225 [bacterium]